MHVRENGAAVEGDDCKSGRNVSTWELTITKKPFPHHHGHHTEANDELKLLATTLPS